MKYSAITLAVLLATSPLHAGQHQIKVIFVARPDAGIPREARSAGIKPDPDSSVHPRSNISFGIVTDLKDYVPLRDTIKGHAIHAITVRYYNGSFKDTREVQAYLTSVLQSEKGSTNTSCPWAEMLAVPSVEATIQFTSGATGKWLLWRQGRSVYRDPELKWWFSYGW
jgi:hypothetical protein